MQFLEQHILLLFGHQKLVNLALYPLQYKFGWHYAPLLTQLQVGNELVHISTHTTKARKEMLGICLVINLVVVCQELYQVAVGTK